MRPAIALALGLAVALGAPGAAHAAVVLSPPQNASVSSTPTFSWRLSPGERSSSLELSPNPAPGDAGGFADDLDRRAALLAETQTSYVVGNRDPLFAGVWFWHLNVFDADFESRWTPVQKIVVRDERIRLRSFNFTNFSCTRQVSVDFTYSDNSPRQPATFRVEFRRRKRGPRVASIAGRADEGRFFQTFRRPRKLRRGRRYYVRLKLRDRGGHVDRSGFRRLRVRSC